MKRSRSAPFRLVVLRLGPVLLLPILLGCSTSEPPPPDVTVTPPSAPEPAPSFEELQQEFLPKIDENKRSVSSYESQRDEIVARKLEDLDRLRGLQEARRGEIEIKSRKIALLAEQLAERRERLNRLEKGDGVLRRELQKEISGLEEEIEAEAGELTAKRTAAMGADEEIRRLDTAAPEELFFDEIRPLYRQGIELHLGFYRGVIELAREQLVPGEEATALIERFEDRAEARGLLLDGREVAPEAFAALSHEFELDRRMSQAWLSALILEVRFDVNRFRLETISDVERSELELLAESLEESWEKNPRLVMYIDGHADSRRFRGSTPCISATKNQALSLRRAEAVRDFFHERLAGEASRIRVDWYGNFSTLAASEPDALDNRRIELRVATERGAGSFDSHRDYFSLREGFEIATRTFRRAGGGWVESGCDGQAVAREIEYLSEDYRELVERLDLAAPVRLEIDGRQLDIRLGNNVVIAHGEGCVAIRPCEAPAP